MKLQFFGAARSVTGSMHLLEAGRQRVLLECGLFQGRRAEANAKNREFPVAPSSLTGCVLSHAHIDHSGNLPKLVTSGYEGEVWATRATVTLAKAMLLDSAAIQEKDAEFLNSKRERADEPVVTPLYTKDDAEEANRRFQARAYGEVFGPAPGVRAWFHDAGHILGSAVTVYEVEEGGRRVRVAFTGDLGRPHAPILRDPQPIPEVDYLITEATYGDRVHEDVNLMKERLAQVVSETVARGGRVVIPAFSVGRTQNLVYYLSQLFHEGALPHVPIFVDSPLAVEATQAYRAHPECYDEEARALLERGDDVFGFSQLRYCRTQEESKRLNDLEEPCVIISASGMCEGGRILHHLRHSIGDGANTVLIVGFQAENTLGRRIVDGDRRVRIYGREHTVRARVEAMSGFSAHADKDELTAWIRAVPGLKKVFVVHGEEGACVSFAGHLEATLGVAAHVPSPGEAVDL
ncbi:MAG: MBL fold metallo-hydrolase [Planctomycetes bacterium]|nr:MBL fold metallo-hydrolase [Planctomycetota bacterium]